MTTDELLAIPDDGIERWLIDGELRENRPTALPRQQGSMYNRQHSGIMANLTFLLMMWLRLQPEPRGRVMCGEAGCRLRCNPDTTVGIYVVYVSAELAKYQSDETTLIDGVPTVIAEILSPSDKLQEIEDKIDTYQKAGVPLVWVIHPHDRTITIYRLGAEPELVNCQQDLTAEPHLPGLRVAVAEVFA